MSSISSFPYLECLLCAWLIIGPLCERMCIDLDETCASQMKEYERWWKQLYLSSWGESSACIGLSTLVTGKSWADPTRFALVCSILQWGNTVRKLIWCVTACHSGFVKHFEWAQALWAPLVASEVQICQDPPHHSHHFICARASWQDFCDGALAPPCMQNSLLWSPQVKPVVKGMPDITESSS
jgi:hypothetical protein